MRIAERLHCIQARLAGEEQLRRLSWGDVLHSSAAWYGLARRSIRGRMRIERLSENLLWIELGPYGIAWPASAPIEHLTAPLAELWVPANSHYYFHPLTPVRSGDRVLDIGACEGSFAVECLRRFGAGAVYAFEPSPSMASALRATARRNGVQDRLHVVEAAAGERPGEIEFLDDPVNPLASRIAIEPQGMRSSRSLVPQVTIDDWASAHGIVGLDYVKIDAEGSDLEVLLGARESLRRWRPAIAVTTYHRPEHCEQMVGFLQSLDVGYRFHVKGIVSFQLSARPVMLHCAVPDRRAE
jgi:FkbM family methyltransferase